MSAARAFGFQLSISCVLALGAFHLDTLVVAGIRGYQRFISPALGPQCGHARALGGETCSAFARRAVAEQGAWTGMRAAMDRFEDCRGLRRGKQP